MRCSNPLRLLALSLVVTAGVAGCAQPGGGLAADLEGPRVEISSSDSWRELRFIAHANTSAPLVGAEVRVHAACDQAADGQVRIMLARGALPEDQSRGESVLPIEEGAEVLVPRLAFAGCTGACEETFAVIFSAEGITAGVRVELPVRIEAELFYEGGVPGEDSVTLELDDAL